MASITDTAQAFFEACDGGKGWEACVPYCHPGASFAAQAEPLTEVRTLKDYTEWMRGLISILPDGRYTLRAFATDGGRNAVIACATFHGTHTGQGGPVAPSGKHTDTEYAYVMEFDGGRIRHMTKVWNASWAMRELGWIA